MLLADMGASVLRIDRPEPSQLGIDRPRRFDLLLRGRQSIAVDLKLPAGKALALRLVEGADALIEGFRPGVTERLGLGPTECLARNPRLVYGRVTGWGQDGPLAQAAGHDLNYIALAGALHAIGHRDGPPTPPLNLLADYAGGALYLAFGLVCAILEARQSGRGQVVDAATVDGVASLLTAFHGMLAAGLDTHERGTNVLDTGAHFYNVYECADGRWISIAAIEKNFTRKCCVASISIPKSCRRRWTAPAGPWRRNVWPGSSRPAVARNGAPLLEGTDACFAPVLTTAEAAAHPHNRARGTYVEIGGITQPPPAPRFSRTRPELPTPPQENATGEAAIAALAGWLDPDEIAAYGAADALTKGSG